MKYLFTNLLKQLKILRIKNAKFSGIIFIRTRTNSEIFKSALKYLSYRQYCLTFVAEKTKKKSKETNRIFRINQSQASAVARRISF